MSQDLCPCGSLKKYSECCEPIIKKAEKASSPEVLMRSLYSLCKTRNILVKRFFRSNSKRRV